MQAARPEHSDGKINDGVSCLFHIGNTFINGKAGILLGSFISAGHNLAVVPVENAAGNYSAHSAAAAIDDDFFHIFKRPFRFPVKNGQVQPWPHPARFGTP